MNKELKKAIVDFMFEHDKDYQLVNNTKEEFRQYIYTPKGEYCFGGKEVGEFVNNVEKIVKA